MSDIVRSPVGGRGEQKQEEGGDSAVERARRALETARTAMVSSDARAGIVHLYEAADLASPDDPALAASALLLLLAPSLASHRPDDARAALTGARAHLPMATGPDRDLLEMVSRAGAAALHLVGARSDDVAPLLAVASPEPCALWTSCDASALISSVAVSLAHAERNSVARRLLEPAVARWRADGDLEPMPLALAALAMSERRAGRPTVALPLAAESRDLAEATGRHRAWLFAHVELANAHSVAGDAEQCRAAAAVVLTDPSSAPLHRTSARSALASVELWSGDPTAVIDLLEPLVEGGSPDPRVALFHQTLASAYVQMGRHEDVEPLRRSLRGACPDAPGRLRGAALLCDALVAGPDERDDRFRGAIDGCGDQAVLRATTQLQYARRLLADGCETVAVEVLSELASAVDENVLGLARSARRDLARLGLEGRAPDSPWLRRARAELQPTPPNAGASPPRAEIQILGGLVVRVEGEVVDLPAGAVSRALAVLALHRSVHLEEMADLLWPDVPSEVGRRRLRNVLSRIRATAGELVARRGDRLELAGDVVVDDDALESRARAVLKMPQGAERSAAAETLLAEDSLPFLPEARYEDWADAGRFRTDARRAALAVAARAAV